MKRIFDFGHFILNEDSNQSDLKKIQTIFYNKVKRMIAGSEKDMNKKITINVSGQGISIQALLNQIWDPTYNFFFDSNINTLNKKIEEIQSKGLTNKKEEFIKDFTSWYSPFIDKLNSSISRNYTSVYYPESPGFKERKAKNSSLDPKLLNFYLLYNFCESVYEYYSSSSGKQIASIGNKNITAYSNNETFVEIFNKKEISDSDLVKIKELLKMPGIDPNLQDRNGFTALMWASYWGNLQVVQEILKHPSIDPNLQTPKGFTALIVASKYGHSQVVQEILKHPKTNPNLKNQYGETALDHAKTDEIKKILSKVIKSNLVRKKSSGGSTATTSGSGQGLSGSELAKRFGLGDD